MKIANKNARSFKLLETFEGGIVLYGSEVKAIREGHADLASSYAKIVGNELFLINAKIFPYQASRIEHYDESRSRKLLLHRKEITAIKNRLSQGNFTLVPLSLFTKNNLIKVKLGLVKGKKQYEKREDLKIRDLKRETELELKNHP